MAYDVTACPVCAGTLATYFATVEAPDVRPGDAIPAQRVWMRCPTCTHLYTAQAWPSGSLGPDEYWNSMLRYREPPVDGNDTAWDYARFADIWDRVRILIKKKTPSDATSLIELDCGKCYFAGAAKDLGLDVTAAADYTKFRPFAIGVGADWVKASVEELNVDPHDIVVFNNLLERLPDPKTALTNAPLSTGGVVYVSTPLSDSAWTKMTGWIGANHLADEMHFFSTQSLTTLITAAGFRKIDARMSTTYCGCTEWILERIP